jgi:hypothetical protein
LLSDLNHRRELGSIGSRRMIQLFSWDTIARHRLADYEAALAARHQVA